MDYKHVEGINKGRVVLFAISTCLWCLKTKSLLKKLGIEYFYVDVDLLTREEKKEALKEVLKWKKKAVYPLIVIDDKKCIPDFQEDVIRKQFE